MTSGTASTSPAGGSMTNEHDPIVRNYVKHFCTRLVQVVVQARTNISVETKCTNDNDWFNIRVDELGEVTAQVRASAKIFPPDVSHFSLDFLLYTADGEILPLETWKVSFHQSSNDYIGDTKSQVYYALGGLLKAAISASRVTPMYRYYVRKQSADTFVILYRVVEGFSDLDLGAGYIQRRLGVVDTPTGILSLNLSYRTKMEIERDLIAPKDSLSPTMQVTIGSPEPAASTPASFQDIVSNFSVSPASHKELAISPSEGVIHVGPAALRRSRLSSGASLSSASDFGSPPIMATASSPNMAGYATERRGSQLHLLNKDIPFAALLQCSITGSLKQKAKFTLDEKVEDEEMLGSPEEREEARVVPARVADSQEPSNKVMETSVRTTTSTMVASTSETIKESVREAPSKDEDDSEEDDGDLSDNESFIKVPQFSSAPKEDSTELGEFIDSMKHHPNIHSTDESFEQLKAQLADFASNRQVFNAFLDEVKERAEKEFS